MNRQALKSYLDMQQELEGCRRRGLGRLCELECCFQVAERYWSQLQVRVSQHEFEKIEDEIKFFKEIKPLFTGEVEYYSLRYHAELFRRDVMDPGELEKFRSRELLRLDRFVSEYSEFFNYINSGCTEKDYLYFLRRNNDLSNFPRARVYDLEEKASTSHDWLLANWLALKRYTRFIDEQINYEENHHPARR